MPGNKQRTVRRKKICPPHKKNGKSKLSASRKKLSASRKKLIKSPYSLLRRPKKGTTVATGLDQGRKTVILEKFTGSYE